MAAVAADFAAALLLLPQEEQDFHGVLVNVVGMTLAQARAVFLNEVRTLRLASVVDSDIILPVHTGNL